MNNSHRHLHKEAKALMKQLADIKIKYVLDPTPVSEEVKKKRAEIIAALENDIREFRAQL